MSDRDNITLPRELVEEAAESLEWADSQVGGDDCYEDAAKALRTALAAPCLEVTVDPRLTPDEAAAISSALAAPRPEHPGYVIGSHWLETAYERICAGEAEADVLRDCGWERVTDALRRDAERYRWMTEDHPENETRRRVYSVTLLFNAHRKEHIDAAIDAAMQEDKT